MDTFTNNVFINCPFDKEYRPYLNLLIFTIKHCGFTPRIASERFNSSEIRLSKIKELIELSQYSIHDLSRIKASKEDEYYRLNMSFEIGLDFGCKSYHPDEKYRNKTTLILENEKYAYQKALSDIAGFDVRCYTEEIEFVLAIRNWFSEHTETSLKSGSSIWDEYNVFISNLYADLKNKNFKEKDIETLPVKEFINYIEEHIK